MTQHTPLMNLSDSILLNSVRHAASKYGRCCDQYQDGFGQFCCHECGQRTMAMLKEVQDLLGIRKDGEKVDCEKETAAAHASALKQRKACNHHEALMEALLEISAIHTEGSDDPRALINSFNDFFEKHSALITAIEENT